MIDDFYSRTELLLRPEGVQRLRDAHVSSQKTQRGPSDRESHRVSIRI